ncbi:oligopeptide ABC transporter permease AppC [Microbacterium luteolum]|jgi:peptide/nickel transport system permease protein|uniref:ABC transporter permease n=1 Tax=Microbacterium luteolum TaxID=69367 RepID=A0ABY7XS13_MICLT|nr:ABC transporter permease [Microbacterium luteolum]WDM44970.1 ABC transporter permease [Microbacterium luteolum]
MSGAGIAGREELLAEQEPQKAPTRQLLKGFLRHRLGVVSLIVLVILLIACFGAGWIAPYPQGQQDLLTGPTPPSGAHWLGTDELGRDYLSEILFSGQISLAIGLAVALLATVVGTALGAISGYVGGWIGELIMRITDLFLIVPAIALLAVILQGLGPSPTTIVLALTALGWTYIARVVRAQVLSLREKDFIDAARGIGASGFRIVVSHLLPNLAGVIVVAMSLAVASSIIAESTLSFLGFGVQPPQTSWGSMLSQAAGYVGTPQVYLLYFPGLFILVTVLCVNFIGDGLRDALDPQGKNL